MFVILQKQVNNYNMKKDKPEQETICPYCGASLVMRWERLSKGLVKTLIKFRKEVVEKNKFNRVHPRKDMNLGVTEYANFQKLRYHGLVAHVRKPDGTEDSGYWLLTRRGNLFCKNQITISEKVLVFRNKIEARGTVLTNLEKVLKNNDVPFWDEKDDFDIEFKDVDDYGVEFDIDGQGYLKL